jgi:hypothetical protein
MKKRKTIIAADDVQEKTMMIENQTHCPFCTEPLKVNDKFQMMITME